VPGFLALVPWIVGALTAAVGVASYTAAKKAQKAAKRPNDEQRGVLVNKESNVEQIPVIYGERRVGGVRVFVSTDGTYKTVGGERTMVFWLSSRN
jgi:predicted phage tail protein